MAKYQYLRVAVPTPLNRFFDYLNPLEFSQRNAGISPGMRVQVPFGKQVLIGCLIELPEETSVPLDKLKKALKLLDKHPLLSSKDLDILEWASRYYHHAPGEVYLSAFPLVLRSKADVTVKKKTYYRLSNQPNKPSLAGRAYRQKAVLAAVTEAGVSADELSRQFDWPWRTTISLLVEKGLVTKTEKTEPFEKSHDNHSKSPKETPPIINEAQKKVLKQFQENPLGIFYLEGVTGSGKTEVYLQIINQTLAEGKQVLVLLPEIALTPQLEGRFRRRLDCAIGCYHSSMTEQERAEVWLAFQQGKLPILLGTRSAVFIPMAAPGLIVLDEEHDASFKQQEGFKFHARDIAVVRATRLNIPLIMGSATPSYESLYNCQLGRFQHLNLPERAGGAMSPLINLLDIREKSLKAGLSDALINEIRKTLERSEQVILFLNRRGFAPVQICHACGWVATCHRCEAHMTLHKNNNREILCCHHCGAQEQSYLQCKDCQSSDIRLLGQGTQRLEQQLNILFPDLPIIRLDRDTTRSKGALSAYLDEISTGAPAIILGTQMLAKGHHFPNVTLVGIVEGDAGLFSTDFRAPERMAQMITQVAGRAGRAQKSGKVLIQTRHPEHPLLQTLINGSYAAFAKSDLKEREAAGLPPFSYQALLRVSAHDTDKPQRFINQIIAALQPHKPKDLDMLGPIPAMIPRLSGRYRFQLLLQTTQRRELHQFVQHIILFIEQLPQMRAVRWAIDIDPLDFS